jgi:hypothetical protein
MSEQEGRLGYQDFYAICNQTQGAGNVLRVGGTVVAPDSGWRVELDEYSGQPSPNQFLLQLTLRVRVPDGPALKVLTPIELEEFRLESPPIEYTQVEFHVEGATDIEPPPVIEVEHPQ